MNARRYSIFVKNLPQEKFNIVDIGDFFKQFGPVLNINLDVRKKAATIKFKEISSAEKADEYTRLQGNCIWGDPGIRLIYNTAGFVNQKDQSNPTQTPGQNQASDPQKATPAPAQVPMLSPEEQEKLKKASELKKKIEETRRKLQEKYNNDLQKLLKKMSQPDMTKEETEEVEKQIEAVKAKIRGNVSQKDKEKQQAKEKLDAERQKKADHKKAIQASKPIEFKLTEIKEELRQIPALAKCLKVSIH